MTPIQRLQEAIDREPNNTRAHSELARELVTIGQVEQAIGHARLAVELSPGSGDLAILLASLLEASGQTEEAWQIVARLLDSGHKTCQLGILYSRMAHRRQRERDALDFVMRLLETDTFQGAAERSSLHFAAAQLLDGLALYDEAFDQASLGNSLRSARYDPGPADRLIRDFTQYFTKPTLRLLPRTTNGSQTPVFIVGMPRSGTTLAEQILASHPSIHGAGELDWMYQTWKSVVQRYSTTPSALTHCLDRISARDADELADGYLQRLQSLDERATRVIDKMPSNFMYLGLIEILFPLARVIYCRRDPLDTCLSCFMTDFATGNDFSYSLSSAGHFSRQCDRMMSHWKDVLHLPILEVEYERVVSDLEGQTRRMLEFLDVPWDKQCLRFHENKRYVATASSSQVHRPIYQTSVGRWRNYERHLGPLRAALG